MINETNKFELLKNKHYKKILKLMTDYEYLVLGSLYTDNSSKMLLLDNFSIMIESEEHLPTVEENEPIVRQYNTLLKNAQKFDNLKSYDHHHLCLGITVIIIGNLLKHFLS